MSKFYITTPIYYASGSVHIGHTYTTIAADVLARYHRTIGDSTFFATGMDEHGAKIEEKAVKADKKPQKFVDEIAFQFQKVWDKLNISYDKFIRTTEKEHIKAVENALQYMKDKGDIYLGKYEGLYCQECEQYKSKRELIDGKCPDHQIEPTKISEECYIFKITKYADNLLKRIENDQLKIRPIERKNEIINFYKQGLNDVSFSRKNVKWGIPLPWDKKHTAYVWADAFLNYLTILGWDGKGKRYPDIFPPEIQLMGKDILRVHATIWPAMLLSLDLSLPIEIFAHGFLLSDKQKMSKALGNVVSPEDLIKRYNIDGTRYLLMKAAIFGQDGDISWEKFDDKYNSDLANGLGNLVARVLTLANKNSVPYRAHYRVPENIKKIVEKVQKNYKKAMEDIKLHEALEEIWKLISFCDEYIDRNKPWQIKDKKKSEKVLSNLLYCISEIAKLIEPFLPETSEGIRKQLKTGKSKILFPRL